MTLRLNLTCVLRVWSVNYTDKLRGGGRLFGNFLTDIIQEIFLFELDITSNIES